MSMRSTIPFPFYQVPQLSRTWVSQTALAWRWVHSFPAWRMNVEHASLIRETIQVGTGTFAPQSRFSNQRATSTLIEFEAQPPVAPAHLLISMENRLALALIDRVLGGDGQPQDTPNSVSLLETECGVLGYFFVRLLDRASTGYWRLHGVSCVDPRTDLRLTSQEDIIWANVWRLGPLQELVEIRIPEATRKLRPPSLAPQWNPSVMVSARCYAAQFFVPASELHLLCVDDIWLADELNIVRSKGEWQGKVWVELEHAPRAKWRCFWQNGTLTQNHKETIMDINPFNASEPLTHAQQKVLSAAQDAPVEVTVELARMRLSLEELLLLDAGQVLTTDQALDAHVTLYAGDAAIARGELVSVDGTVGVRITQRLT